jgi:hypothetical protein
MLSHPLFPLPPHSPPLMPPLSGSPPLSPSSPTTFVAAQNMSPARLQGCSPMVIGDPSVMTAAMSYLDRSKPCGKPLPELRSREVTSGDPALSLSLRAPEEGAQRLGGGGAVITWPSHVGPT